MKPFFIVLFLISTSVFSQYKYEREYRVKEINVPKSSVQIIKSWNFKNKVKWYAEESNEGKTFEAKVCYNKYKYSIEFSNKGEILDAEKTIKFKKLDSKTKGKIKNALNKRFVKYKIKKIQIQYSGNQSQIYTNIFQIKTEQKTAYPKYEIIVKGNKEKSTNLYEILIDSQGIILKELQFAPQNSDNLEF